MTGAAKKTMQATVTVEGLHAHDTDSVSEEIYCWH
jgi:hypothetical protein